MYAPKVLVLTGDGINCENETALAFNEVGCEVSIMHVNTLLEAPSLLHSFDIFALPGGFSFGDELGSGKILALKIRHGLLEDIRKFIADKKPIIGICNGFQVLMKLGLLPNEKELKEASLTYNNHGTFLNRWVELKAEKNSVCKWTDGETNLLNLPVRHGEGRVVFSKGQEDQIYNKLKERGQVVLSYTQDINGSHQNIAGLCDPTGLVFGLMPHPEAAIFNETAQQKTTSKYSYGYNFFKNITHYVRTEHGKHTN